MVSIRITPDELLARTQMQLAAAIVEKTLLDEKLTVAISVMTPDQLQQVGIQPPQQPTLLPVADATVEPAPEAPAEPPSSDGPRSTRAAERTRPA